MFASIEYPKKLWSLPTGTLAKRLADHKEGKRFVSGYYQNEPGINPDGKMFYLESDFMPGLRWQWADEIVNIRHTGWFTDPYKVDKIRGLVFRLSHERGFLAAWSMGKEMIGEVEYYIYGDERQAAFAADKLAQSKAEDMYNEAEREQEAERVANLCPSCGR